jgi:hypothetical protein
MAKEQDSLGKKLKRMYPDITEKVALAALIKKYKNYRATAKALGVSLVTISRWGQRLGVSEPPPFPHFYVLRALKQIEGNDFGTKLDMLIKEEGTWIKVAVRLGVTVRELKMYRKMLGKLPRSKWKERCDIKSMWDARNKNDDGGYYGF